METSPNQAQSASDTQAGAVKTRTARDEALARAISHDVRAPVRAIAKFAEFAQEHACERPDETHRYLEVIREQAGRLDAQLRALVRLLRLGPPHAPVESVPLVEIFAEAQTRLGMEGASTHAELTIEDPPPVRVCGRREELCEAVAELIRNAVRFHKAQRAHVRVWAVARDDARVDIFVEDDGIGIEPDRWDDVFALFRRNVLPEEYPGVGAGLALVRRIAELHGGCVEVVRSAPGEGTLMQLTLPTDEKAGEDRGG